MEFYIFFKYRELYLIIVPFAIALDILIGNTITEQQNVVGGTQLNFLNQNLSFGLDI